MTEVKGYTVLTQVLSGWELMWRTTSEESNGEDFPQVFETERAAQLEILDDLQDDIEQFKAGEREWDEIHWPDNEYMVAYIEISEDGKIVVKDDSECLLTDGPTLIETTLQLWRAQL